MPITNWEISREDFDLLLAVADRAMRELTRYPDDRRTLIMDLNACHSNGCPLDFASLLKAGRYEFSHDIYGIRKAIDRTTGKLTEDAFQPRYALASDQHEHVGDTGTNSRGNRFCAVCGVDIDKDNQALEAKPLPYSGKGEILKCPTCGLEWTRKWNTKRCPSCKGPVAAANNSAPPDPEDAVCRHCHKVIRTVPKYYCPRSPNQMHEPVDPAPPVTGDEAVRIVDALIGAEPVSIDGEEYRQSEADLLLKEGGLIEPCPEDECPQQYHRWEGILDADLRAALVRLGAVPGHGQDKAVFLNLTPKGAANA